MARTSSKTPSHSQRNPGSAASTSRTRRRRKTSGSPPTRKLSRRRRPEEMSLEAWQVALRREFSRDQNFKLKNLGEHPIFSEFHVTNPQTGRTYRAAIRGDGLGDNYCSCPDFAVNTLGTCKHVEFLLARLKRKRGGKSAFAKGFRPPYSEIYLRYGPQREIVFTPGTDCPESLRKLAEGYFDAAGVLRGESYQRFHLFLREAMAGQHEVRCYEDALAFISQVRDRAELAKRIDQAFPDGPDSPAFKKLIKAPLYPYQRQGVLFAAKAGRCLLADDMGLGKTIEAIAAAEVLARTAGIERVLIVCPTSLKHQWQREIEKFIDRTAMVIEGLSARRAEGYAADAFFKITNYDVVFRDLDMIRQWSPELVILDEAQRIKNWQTRTAKSVKQLDSDYAFVLTGTPLENRLEELHSIVEFVDRFRLGPMFRFLNEHQHLDENGKVIGYRNLSRISETLSPILIRRTKDSVLQELPERMEKRFFVPMTDEQMQHHEENRAIVARIVHKWRRFGFLSEIDQRRLTCALQNMRMSCDSTYLLDHTSDHGVKADELVTLLAEILEDPHAKAVIFSQWVRMHELIANRLANRKWGHVMFHGSVPGPKRRGLIRQFQQDGDCRLFLSTDAGGVGLNLQNASVVVIVDQPWNPAVLEQRIGRVHRLGQHRPVRVVHFISQGTIEEGMLSLLAFKKSMFSGVLDGGKDEVFLGGTRLKRFMDSVDTATGEIPKSAPEPSEPPAPEEAGVSGEAAESARPGEVPGPAPSQQQALAEVISAGAVFLGKLSQALQTAGRGPGQGGGPGPLAELVTQDEKTHQPFLKLPLPSPETVQKIAGLLAAFTGGG